MSFLKTVQTKYSEKPFKSLASGDNYKFKDKSSQIEELVKFYNDMGKSQEQYMEQSDYLDNFMILLGEQSQPDLHSMGRDFREAWDKIPTSKKKAAWQWVKDNAQVEFTHMGRNDFAAYSAGPIGQEELQISGISGKVNGKQVSDVLEALKKGLSNEEVKKAERSADHFVKGDLLYIDMSYEMIDFVVDVDELLDAIK